MLRYDGLSIFGVQVSPDLTELAGIQLHGRTGVHRSPNGFADGRVDFLG